jgi:methionyl-tRNA synthetase
MLMSAQLPLPRQVFGHGFLTLNGQRMSKSLGTIVDPIEAADRLGHDPLRLYLIKEVAFGGDGDFSWERYEERYNVDLANNLGNLVSRVAAMAERYRQGRLVPSGAPSDALARAGDEAATVYRRAMDGLAVHEGAAAAFRLIDATNAFIAETAPWKLAKDPSAVDRLSQVLFDAAEAIRLAAVLLAPIMPSSSAEILRRVGVPSTDLHLDRDGRWRTDGERILKQEGPLWPRYDASGSASEAESLRSRPRSLERLGGGAPSRDVNNVRREEPIVTENPTPPATPPAAAPSATPATGDRLSIYDFMKVELRVAKVLAAESVPKSKRLVKLRIDAGTEQRTIVAGIAEAYQPEQLVGRTVVVVANLKPAKLMGIESNGMVLAASPDGGKPIVVTFDEPPPPGARVR